MNERERYLATLLFGTPDKIPFEPGQPREKTLKRWHHEGLPENQNWYEFLIKQVGINIPIPCQRKLQPDINFRMHPTFEEKVLEHREGHYIVQDWMGNITEISDEYDYTYIREPKDFVTRKWHAFPVTNHEDFEKMKKRYDPHDPVRYPQNFTERVKKMKQRNYLASIKFSGPFWQLRELCGLEPLCLLFLEDPDFVKEMISFWTDFISITMERILEANVLDCIWINEDMAYKEKSMISPLMVRDFLKPTWQRWADEAKQAGVPIIDEDSDGNIEELIPIWIDSGINVCDPIEVAAGNDINKFRNTFKHKMAYKQGIDKRCIAQGGKVLEAEMDRITPVIMDGGYIPGCDHGVPFDISWQNFVHYACILAELTGWL